MYMLYGKGMATSIQATTDGSLTHGPHPSRELNLSASITVYSDIYDLLSALWVVDGRRCNLTLVLVIIDYDWSIMLSGIIAILSLLSIPACSDIQQSCKQPGSIIAIEENEFESTSVSITVEDILQGVWRVLYLDNDMNPVNLGIILIDSAEYQFIPFSDVSIPSWFSSRFSFVRNLHGSVEFGYLPESGQAGSNVLARPDDSLNEFNDRAVLVTCRFDNGEIFYIILDLEGMELYFHGMLSEIQLYYIYKNILD